MRNVRVLFVVLALWCAYNGHRIGEPFKRGHDAYISSQIGAYAYRHVHSGLRVTRGANLAAVGYDGEPSFYVTYTPFASWLLAIPMAVGVPFDPAVRGFMFTLSLWFLASLWGFSRNVWGVRVANLAIVCAAIMPIGLQWSLACIWEIMALAPAFCVLWLVSSPRPRDRRWIAATAVCGVAAGMFSWMSWAIVLPCALREARGGRRLAAGLAAVMLGVPALVQLWTLRVSGSSVGLLMGHILWRASGVGADMNTSAYGFHELFDVFWDRATVGLGLVPAACTVIMTGACIARIGVRPRGPSGGAKWILVMLAFAVPLNLLARNVATIHNFFPVLFWPLAAICTALVIERMMSSSAREGRDEWAWRTAAGLMVAFMLISSTWRQAGDYRPSARDLPTEAIARAIGQQADGSAVIIGSPFFGLASVADGPTPLPPSPRPPLSLPMRQMSLTPAFGCQTDGMALCCYDGGELKQLVSGIPPGRRVVILENRGDLEPLPASAEREDFGPYVLAVLPPRP